ncbi:MAG: carboxylate-amine ligase, partial [Gammaproteobacteria bacterium]
ELIDLVRDDAVALGCLEDVEHIREILAHGTSAHRQRSVYKQALADGATADEAGRAVVDHLIAETARGL